MLRLGAFAVVLAALFTVEATGQVERDREAPASAIITTAGNHTVTVNDRVWIGVPTSSAPANMVKELKVTVDGKEVKVDDDKDTTWHGMTGGGHKCYKWTPTKAGKVVVKITPLVGDNKKPGKERTFTIEVKAEENNGK